MSAKDCMFRIHRDVRFSKDKDPYKTNFGAFIAKGGRKSPYAGYYMHMEPGSSFLGGGIYMPSPAILKAIRNDIFDDPEELKSILNDPDFKKHFGGIYGEKLKTAPKGFPKDFPDIELLNHKHYATFHRIEYSLWLADDAPGKIAEIFKTQHKLNRYLNSVVEGVV